MHISNTPSGVFHEDTQPLKGQQVMQFTLRDIMTGDTQTPVVPQAAQQGKHAGNHE